MGKKNLETLQLKSKGKNIKALDMERKWKHNENISMAFSAWLATGIKAPSSAATNRHLSILGRGQLCGFGFLSPPFHSYLGLYLGLPDHVAYALTMDPFYLETVDL